jgi:hypothetical protein
VKKLAMADWLALHGGWDHKQLNLAKPSSMLCVQMKWSLGCEWQNQ